MYATKWGSNGSYGWADITSGRFVAAYTHQFGNGISGTLSLEDTKERKRGNYNGANALSILGVAPTVDTRGGNTWPEIVGQLRIDQAWGGFHLAANVMNNHVAYNCGGASGTTTVAAGGCSELAGNPSDKVGGGVTAAFKFNVADRRQRCTVHRRYVVEGRNHRRVPQQRPRLTASRVYGGADGVANYGSIIGGYIWDSVYSSTARTGAAARSLARSASS